VVSVADFRAEALSLATVAQSMDSAVVIPYIVVLDASLALDFARASVICPPLFEICLPR
jgi:hypothetical protein